jgi:hypothetical protein
MSWDDADNALLADIAEALNPTRLEFIPRPLERIGFALERIADTLERINPKPDLKTAQKLKPIGPDQVVPLTGQELLDQIKQLGDVAKSTLVLGCGYVSHKKNGGYKLDYHAFYEALLDARGVEVAETKQEVS